MLDFSKGFAHEYKDNSDKNVRKLMDTCMHVSVQISAHPCKLHGSNNTQMIFIFCIHNNMPKVHSDDTLVFLSQKFLLRIGYPQEVAERMFANAVEWGKYYKILNVKIANYSIKVTTWC